MFKPIANDQEPFLLLRAFIGQNGHKRVQGFLWLDEDVVVLGQMLVFSGQDVDWLDFGGDEVLSVGHACLSVDDVELVYFL
jgi:hypothetical protein